MKIYEKIENPINNDEILSKIIETYIKDMPYTHYFYSSIVRCYAEGNKFNRDEFKKFERIIRFTDIDEARSKLPMEERQSLEKYTAEEIDKIFMKTLVKFKLDPSLLYGKSDEAIIHRLVESFMGNHGDFYTAGYHVYDKSIQKDKSALEEKLYKIYLNISYDHLYKFALKYMEVCKKEGIPYAFKVLTPDRDVASRSEKICIYANKDEILKVIDIVRAIIDANPGLLILNPPITTGKIDGLIGFGCDPGIRGYSFNKLRVAIIGEVLDEYFKGISGRKARKMIEGNPQAIQQIRAKIKALADKYKIDQETFCFSDGRGELFKEAEENYVSEPLKCDESELRIDDINPTELSEYTRLRVLHGKDSPEVMEFLSKSSKENGKTAESNDGTEKENAKSGNNIPDSDYDDANR